MPMLLWLPAIVISEMCELSLDMWLPVGSSDGLCRDTSILRLQRALINESRKREW